MFKCYFKGAFTLLINFTFWAKGNNLTNDCHPLLKYVLPELLLDSLNFAQRGISLIDHPQQISLGISHPLPGCRPPVSCQEGQGTPQKTCSRSGRFCSSLAVRLFQRAWILCWDGFIPVGVKALSRFSGNDQPCRGFAANVLFYCWAGTRFGTCTTAFHLTIAKTEGYRQ